MNIGKNVLIGIFDDRYDAELAFDKLNQAGFSHDDLGFVIRGADAVEGGMITDALGTKDGHGLAVGAATGALAGGILGAVAVMLVPGVGPVLAAGVLASALGFATAGAAVGGLIGAMTGLGISEDEALFYEQQFNSGKALVVVKLGIMSADAEAIIRKHNGYFLNDTLPPAMTGASTEDATNLPDLAI